MADYFTRLSFEFELPSEALATAAAARMKALDEALLEGVPEDEKATVPKALHGFFGECAGVRVSAEGTKVWVHDDGAAHVNLVAAMVQTILSEFDPGGCVGFEWSSSCSKPRLDGFGGGAAMVWSDDVKWATTASMLERFRAERDVDEDEAAAEREDEASATEAN
jgi:hypothetical protein